MRYLSKSDFKVAQVCATKLYYKKHRYPTTTDENEYMAMLADGGYMVGLLAQLLYPEGIEIDGTTEETIKLTDKLISDNKSIVLFEPAISVNDQLIRIDILIKNGKSLKLIEVKSKSFSSDEWATAKSKGKKYWDTPEFQPYLEDVGFQKKVLQEKYPEFEIESYLFLPDKSKTTTIDGLIGLFSIEKSKPDIGFRKTKVNFTGDEMQLQELRNDNILTLVKVDEWVDQLMPEIRAIAKDYVKSILADKKIEVPISCSCNGCEYTLTDDEHTVSGFDECWKKLAIPKPHILELAYLGQVNRKKEEGIGVIDKLIAQGKTGIHDVPLDYVTKKDGSPFYNNRPLYQLSKKEEFILPGFFDIIKHVEYPLHFIDFETSQMAIPYHTGMRPYEKVIFQWSCHTINKPGAELEWSGWLNTKDAFPNIEFAHTLKKQVGDSGTLLTWSAYENTQLRSIYETLTNFYPEEAKLLSWLDSIVDNNDRILDLNKLALQFYFHPVMGGRTSIKVTLPAVLQSAKSPRIVNWLKDESLYQKDSTGGIKNPYELLPEPQPIYEGHSIKVKDGGGAMLAYQDMLYGINKNDSAVKKQYHDALNKYCKLDTLAMVIIWEHWMSLKK